MWLSSVHLGPVFNLYHQKNNNKILISNVQPGLAKVEVIVGGVGQDNLKLILLT